MEPSDQPHASYPTSWELGIIITSLFFGSFLIALDTNIINVAIPRISSDFHSLGDIAWYGTAYLLTITAFQPIFGSLYKFFSTSVVYKVSIVIFEVGSVLCATATSSAVFIFGRAIAGLGAAGILQGALSIISQIVPLEQRPMYMGIVISVFAVTVCVGPPLGGAFTQHSSWRWCFWINLPIGAAVLVALTVFLKLKREDNQYQQMSLKKKLASMDPFGCLTFISAVCCLLLALQWGGQTKPWKSAMIIGLLAGFAGLAILFVCIQLILQDNALIPIHVIRRRSIWTGVIVLFFLGSSNYLISFFMPFWFQSVRNIKPVDSGVNFIPYLLPQIVALVIVGVLVRATGYYVPYMVLGELVCIAGMALLTQLSETTTTVKWASFLVVAGLGMGMAMQLPYTAVQVTLPDEDIPTGNGLAVLFYQLGGATAISFGQTITISTIIEQLPSRIPGLPVDAVLKAGASGLSDLVSSPDALRTLKSIWNTAIDRTMILSVALVAASVPFTLGMEWLSVKKTTKSQVSEAESKNNKQAPGEIGPLSEALSEAPKMA
ncbi:MFS general substrate transporter [Lindgomyces ingoldianus]|uniref:MFS general substrate transporter n=1 Tax=Lindgomyces ingoldianus TaxID=673940 RepID=A0ACB6QV39_9PLEO|nr:MFS general substrate transporter [Lindgomyces ingoldianus]KAF2470380.1 MFS general substrate transporter [Lindgomyces ingoldianus]